MHELPITENILEITLRYAKQANALQVKTIYLVIGQLASVVDESVQFYWDIIAKNTIAENAVLSFKRIPATFQCRACSFCFSPGEENFYCPKCNSFDVKIISGNEFFLEAIDVE